MSFIQFKLDKSVNQSRGIFDKFIYSPGNGDTSEDVLVSGYFAESRFIEDPEWDGSIIEANLADGFFVFQVHGDSVVDTSNKAYVFVKSDETYSISNDSNNPTIFNTGATGLVLEINAKGWQLEPTLGGVRNVSGRTIQASEGLVSTHTVNANASSSILFIYSETSTDNGSTWVKNDESGREQTVSGTSQEYGSKSSQAFSVADQAIVRFRAFSDTANVSFTPVSFVADGDTIDGPSFRWRLTEV